MTAEELRNELGSLIWKTATNLVHGGKVSPVQFMDFMLGSLFYRFISEDVIDYCNKLMREAGVPNPDYANMPDEMAENAREQIINAKGFFILPSHLFINVANKAKNNPELNTTLANNFRAFEDSAIGTASESDVKGLFANFNTNDPGLGGTVAERCELLTTLLESVRDLEFDKYQDSGLDVFGICYEYLIKMYALNSGTKGGEFYTPSEVTKLMAYFVKKEGCTSVFDPFCGTASIVHELADTSAPVHFEGQELMQRTALYARLNIDAVYGNDCNISTCDSFGCWNNKHFDAVVSCPPLALRLSERQMWEAEQMNPEYPCRSVEDIMQIRSFHLNHADLTVTLLAHGFCFRGNRDYELRRYLIDNNLVDTIVALPANILYGTAIPTIVLVCKRNRHFGEPVKFIHAEDYFQGDRRKRTFDYNRFVEMVEGNACDCVEVSPDEIVKYDCG